MVKTLIVGWRGDGMARAISEALDAYDIVEGDVISIAPCGRIRAGEGGRALIAYTGEGARPKQRTYKPKK